jgi:hypothetical protein
MGSLKTVKKGVALLVGSAFMCFIFFSSFPVSAKAKPLNAGTSLTMAGSTPGVLEKAAPKPMVKKKKKSILPLVLITAGGIGVMVLALLLAKKSESTPEPASEQLHEDFTTAASASWKPRRSALWSVGNGYYTCTMGMTTNPKNWWEWSVYDHAWSKASYTVEAKMKVTLEKAEYGIMLSDTTNMNKANVYLFLFLGDGLYKVRRIIGYDLYTSTNTGAITDLKDWTAGGAKAVTWNTIKIAKSDNSYVLSVNGNSLFTFSDSAHDPRYVSIIAYSQLEKVQLDVDSLNIDVSQ